MPSLRARTIPAAAARRSRSGASSAETGAAGVFRGAGGRAAAGALTPSSAPTRAARRSSRPTFSSMARSSTSPRRTAAASLSSDHGVSGPGMARSVAARAASAVLRTASQSETTRPSKFHSDSSGADRSGFSVMVGPLTAL